jgi:urease accessory protein
MLMAPSASPDAPAATGGLLERSRGVASLRVERRDGTDRVADLFQSAPCRFLFPDPRPGDPLTAVALTTTGGLTGGDRAAFNLTAGAGTRLTVASQAAEKIYRSMDDDEVRVQVALSAGPDSWLEWLMQETIVFDRARLARETVIDCVPGAQVLATEAVVLGRTASAERFTQGFCLDRWVVRRDDRPVWIDAQRLEGKSIGAAFGIEGRIALATVLLVGDRVTELLGPLRCRIADWGAAALATVIDCCLVVRVSSVDAQACRADVGRIAGFLRNAAAGLPGEMPTVWRC